MRSYAAVPPSVWQTDVKKIRGDADAIAVYFHLITSPHATMIGLYPLDLQYVAIDIGSPLEGAWKGLRRVVEAGIATFDEQRDIVWVHEMAVSQVAPRLSPKDNKVSAVAKLLSQIPICPISLAFYQKYVDVFHLRNQLILEDFDVASLRGFEGASKGLRSKEQELGSGQDQFRCDDERLGSTHAREQDFDAPQVPYKRLPTMEANKQFLVQMGVPRRYMEDALRRLLHDALFPCDIDDWKREARDERAA